MPRAGGEADKFGNRYEAAWTVDRLLAVATGELIGITVEPFGDDALGVEFVCHDGRGRREFHSVKRQRADGEWTLQKLSTSRTTGRSVLGALFDKLQMDQEARCVFVSATGASQLAELSDRARRSQTGEEFRRDVDTNQTLRAAVERKILGPQVDWVVAHDWLRRTQAVLVDELFLTRQVERQIASLLYRLDRNHFEAADVRRSLAEFVLQHLGSEINSAIVWSYLTALGYGRRDWAADEDVRDRVSKLNRDYIRNVEIDLINGGRIERSVTGVIVEQLVADGGAKTILVLAAAGFGKSCILAQVLGGLDSLRRPALVVRLDRHDDAHSTTDIGRQMELPRSPAVVLAGIANGGQCVLIVDQLDALSRASGRSPQLWDVFDVLREEASSYPNMRLLMACRAFDMQHDHRLRTLRRCSPKPHLVEVELLPSGDVERAVTDAGIDSSQLSAKQKEILRTPLHLLLFLEGKDIEPAAFASVRDLFDRFWDRKQQEVSTRLAGRSDWTHVIDAICGEMSRRQSLQAARESLDVWPATKDAMQSEHVLVADGTQLRFFHETFFDYAFARRFCAGDQTLTSFLRSSEQHLFRRAQVRQILAYLRDGDPRRYLRELRSILTQGTIRFHLKKFVFQWLGSLADPTADEWHILDGLLTDTSLREHALATVRNSIAWFDLLDELGEIAAWLADQDDVNVRIGLWLLTLPHVRRQRSESVARLISPYRRQGQAWDDRLRSFFWWGDCHHSRPMQELFLECLDDGLFDTRPESTRRAWWGTLQDALEPAGQFVVEAIVHWLDRTIAALGASEEQQLRRDDFDTAAEHLILKAAERHPEIFARQMLPRVIRMVELTALSEGDDLRRDRTWLHRFQGASLGITDAILDGTVSAFRALAQSKPQVVDELLGPLRETPYRTLAYILLRAWSANAAHFGDLAIAFLVGDGRRLEIGYSSWSGRGDGRAAVSRETIQVCLPHATPEHRMRLEEAILSRSASSADEPERGNWVERLLLEAFGDANLSDVGARRLRDLRETFPEQDVAIPEPQLGAHAVGSPIAPEDAAVFSDEQWLDAMRQYNVGWESRTSRSFEGGAEELSRVLQPLARRNRERFSLLALRMDDSMHPRYFEAILDGICGRCNNLSKEEREADDAEFRRLETEVALRVIRRLHRLPNRPCGRSICWAFEKLAHHTIPETDLGILRDCAVDDPDPPADLEAATGATPGDADPEHIRSHGYNSVRGAAACAVMSLLLGDYGRASVLLPLIEWMAADPSMPVRTCVFMALLPLLNHDRDAAVRVFLAACQGADRVFGCNSFETFINYAMSTHYEALRPLLQAALQSTSKHAVEAAARQTCLAALVDTGVEQDAAVVRGGTPVMRLAAATVYAHNLRDKAVGPACAEHLAVLFNDDDQAVRERAARCFWGFGDADFSQHVELIRKYGESRAFPQQHDRLLYDMEQSTWQLPDITLRLAERFIEACGPQGGDISSAAAAGAPSAAKLVVRVYTQTDDEATKTKCLDLIDDMERHGFFGINEELAEHDR